MSEADQRSALYSLVDQMGPSVTKFFDDPADYYDALNQGQRYVLIDAIRRKAFETFGKLIVSELATDTNPLANPCEFPCACWDATNRFWVPLLTPEQFWQYQDIALTSTMYATVVSTGAGANNIFQTIPSSGSYTVIYVKPAPLISSGNDCQLSPLVHARVVQEALMILINRDPDSPAADAIETYRDQLAKFRFEKFPDSPYVPSIIPYSQPRT